jgi:streptomycin 6-kinase
VRVHTLDGPAILMEHCPGPSLGDLARSGRDEQATDILCDVIRTLHSARLNPAPLEPLAARFVPLTSASLDGDLGKPQGSPAISSPNRSRPAHSDLHHENVLSSPRGWLAFDPKGIWGDPAYEAANAFRNPEGLGERLYEAARIKDLAARFSRKLGHAPRRILGWAAAHCALSTRWSLEDGRDTGDDLRLLPLLLKAHATA